MPLPIVRQETALLIHEEFMGDQHYVQATHTRMKTANPELAKFIMTHTQMHPQCAKQIAIISVLIYRLLEAEQALADAQAQIRKKK